MKYQYIGLSLFVYLVGCAQLMHGEEQPVKQNGKDNSFYTSCSGAVENWGSCNNKASRTCVKGYEVIEKTEKIHGGIRTMTFKCL